MNQSMSNFTFLNEINNNLNIGEIDVKNLLIEINEIEKRLKDNWNLKNSIDNFRRIISSVIDGLLDHLSLATSDNDVFLKADLIYQKLKYDDDIFTTFEKILKIFDNDFIENILHNSYNNIYLFSIDLLKNLHHFLIIIFKKIYQINLNKVEFDYQIYDNHYLKEIKNEIVIENNNKYKNEFNWIKSDIKSINCAIFDFIFKQNNIELVIPEYQRQYDWNQDNIIALCDDINNSSKTNSNHYFGVIAVKTLYFDNNLEKHKVKIIDGQQRLTSFVLILCAIKCYLKNNYYEIIDVNAIFSDIDNHLKINNIKYSDLFLTKQSTNLQNQNELVKVLEFWDHKYEIGKHKSKLNYLQNFDSVYKYFQNKFDAKDDKINLRKILNFYHSLKNNLIIVLIEFNNITTPLKKELTIFENINSKGKTLELIDFVKNYIFNLCSEKYLSESEKTNKINTEFDNHIIRYFNNLDKEDISDFFKRWTNFYSGKEISKDVKIQFHYFREMVDKLLKDNEIQKNSNFDEKQYKSLLFIFEKYTKWYIDSKFKLSKYVKENNLLPLLDSIFNKKTTPFIYLHFLFNDVINDSNNNLKEYKDNLNKIYLLITKLIVCHSIMEGVGDSSFLREILEIFYKVRNQYFKTKLSPKDLYNVLVKEINNQITFDFSLLPEKINNLSIKKDGKLELWIEKCLLLLIEYDLNNYLEGGAKIQLDYQNLEVEHIMPRDLKKWKDDIIEWNKNQYLDISEINYENYAKPYLNKLGNFIHFNEIKNKKASNNIFSEKKKYYENSYLVNSQLYYSKNNSSLSIKDKEVWSFDLIEKRTNFIIELLIKRIFSEFNKNK